VGVEGAGQAGGVCGRPAGNAGKRGADQQGAKGYEFLGLRGHGALLMRTRLDRSSMAGDCLCAPRRDVLANTKSSIEEGGQIGRGRAAPLDAAKVGSPLAKSTTPMSAFMVKNSGLGHHPPTVRLQFHCRHRAALPRTADGSLGSRAAMRDAKKCLLDHLIGKNQYRVGNLKPNRLRGLQVDDQLELGRGGSSPGFSPRRMRST
jgi:hypothetical protein